MTWRQLLRNIEVNKWLITLRLTVSSFIVLFSFQFSFCFFFCLFGYGPIMSWAWPLTPLSRRIHFKLRINVRIVCYTFLKNKRCLFPDPAVVIHRQREAGLIFSRFFLNLKKKHQSNLMLTVNKVTDTSYHLIEIFIFLIFLPKSHSR